MVSASLTRLLSWGTQPHHTVQERKRILVTNGCVLVIILISLMFIAVYASIRLHSMTLVTLAYICAYLGVLALNRAKHVLWGKWTFSLLGISHITLVSVLLGQQTNFELFLIVVCSVPFVIYDLSQKWHILSALALCIGAFLLLQWLYTTIPPISSLPSPLIHVLRYTNIIALLTWICLSNYYNASQIQQAETLLVAERDRAEQLLLNILPAPIAERLKSGEQLIADRFPQVSVLFSDLVGFTLLSSKTPADQIVAMLDEIVSSFDELCAQHGLEKIKTIGDAYMAAAGLPHPTPDHANRAAHMALAMFDVVDSFNQRRQQNLQIRLGIHCGPVVAGIIGKQKFVYDIWGDTVNIAARMESHGTPGSIHISEAFQQAVQTSFVTEERGTIEIKGKGPMKTFFLHPNPQEPGGLAKDHHNTPATTKTNNNNP